MTATFDLTTLIPYVRLRLGDMDPLTYRFTDEWLEAALLLAAKMAQHYMGYKYLLDVNNDLYRNVDMSYRFILSEPPVVEPGDENVIVVMTCILILEGSLESSAWQSVGSWRDAEISFSNIESGRIRNDILKSYWDELNGLIVSPTKKLARTTKQSLPGYLHNRWERDTKY